MAPTAGLPDDVEAARGGAIAQLGERVVRNDEVGGSIPPGSTKLRLAAVSTARSTNEDLKKLLETAFERVVPTAVYSAACAISAIGSRASQPPRNCVSHARSATSWTARSAK